MFYTVDLTCVPHSRLFRLQQDGSWRSIQHDETVADADVRLSVNVVHQYLFGRNLEFTIEGRPYRVNPSPANLGRDLFFIEPKLYRTEPPEVPIPSREELHDVIRRGNDSQNNTLVLDLNGHFNLLNPEEVDVVDNVGIAVRNETFVAGNDYVGAAAARDAHHMKDLYLSSLKHWVDHLATGEINIYNDLPATQSEQDLLIELKGILGTLG